MPFGGWQMPLRYQSEVAEHHTVRQKVGLFDLSHMGEFLVRGDQAEAFLQSLLTNDLSRLPVGKAQYTFLLNAEGGILDDLIAYKIAPDLFMLVVNAANTPKDWAWLNERVPAGVTLEDISDRTVLIALSGPHSTAILAPLTEAPIASLPYYAFVKGTVAGIPNVLIATTGYTGEWTYELFVLAEEGIRLWQALMKAGESHGLQPAGLAARNTLRLEMGYLLCGTDIDETTTPLEAGAGWAVKLQKGPFLGREALLRQKTEGLTRRLVGLVTTEARFIPRGGMPILDAHRTPIGRITSGSISPTLKVGIGLGYVPAPYQEGDTVYLDLRGQLVPLTIRKPPFVGPTSLTQRLQSAAS